MQWVGRCCRSPTTHGTQGWVGWMQHRIELGLLERGAFGHLLPLERAPPVAPPLHGQKLQRGAAARRFVLLHPAAAFPGRLCPGAKAVRAECAAEAKQSFQDFGAGSGEENLSARTLDVPNIVRRFGGPNSAKPKLPRQVRARAEMISAGVDSLPRLTVNGFVSLLTFLAFRLVGQAQRHPPPRFGGASSVRP